MIRQRRSVKRRGRRTQTARHFVEVAYDSRWHGWGVPDKKAERLARGRRLGSGTDLINGRRDITFGYATKRAATEGLCRLRKAFVGYRLRVRMWGTE